MFFMCAIFNPIAGNVWDNLFGGGGADFAPLGSSKMIHLKSRDVYEVIKKNRTDRPKNGGRGPLIQNSRSRTKIAVARLFLGQSTWFFFANES